MAVKLSVKHLVIHAPLQCSEADLTTKTIIVITMDSLLVKVEREGTLGEFSSLSLQFVDALPSPPSLLFARALDSRVFNIAVAPQGLMQTFMHSTEA